MITNVMKRAMSTPAKGANSYARILRNIGANTNVASHNDERRDAYKGTFNFKDSWGLGVEGFSHGPIVNAMDPLMGSRGEFKWLFALLVLLPVLAYGRRDNEDGVVSALGKSTNKYAKMDLDTQSASINTLVRH